MPCGCGVPRIHALHAALVFVSSCTLVYEKRPETCIKHNHREIYTTQRTHAHGPSAHARAHAAHAVWSPFCATTRSQAHACSPAANPSPRCRRASEGAGRWWRPEGSKPAARRRAGASQRERATRRGRLIEQARCAPAQRESRRVRGARRRPSGPSTRAASGGALKVARPVRGQWPDHVRVQREPQTANSDAPVARRRSRAAAPR